MEDSLKTRLKAAFFALRNAEIVKTQKDFAQLLGYTETTISMALKGGARYLTNNMVYKAEEAVKEHIKTADAPAPKEPDIIIPAATAKMYSDMAESIRILSELVAAQQKGAAENTTPANAG